MLAHVSTLIFNKRLRCLEPNNFEFISHFYFSLNYHCQWSLSFHWPFLKSKCSELSKLSKKYKAPTQYICIHVSFPFFLFCFLLWHSLRCLRCILPAKFWRLTGWINIAPRNLIFSLRLLLPFAIHILKALDVLFHMEPPNIWHTYSTATATRFRDPSKQWFWGSKVEITL